MKKSYLFLVFLLSLVLTLNASLVSADEPPDMVTDFQIQNLDSSKDATVTIKFYKTDGTVAATILDAKITAGSSVNYTVDGRPGEGGFPAGVGDSFEGSVVIQSDTPVGAIVNLFGSSVTSNRGFGGGVYDSLSEGATTVSAPAIFSNFIPALDINTFFYVQNTGSSDASVSVAYSGTDGSCDETATIPANASKKFAQEANTCLEAIDSVEDVEGYFGSATITSGEPVVVTVVQYDVNSILIYNGFTDAVAHTNPVMPLYISNAFNVFTGIAVQNTGDESTEVTVTYTPSTGNWGSQCTETHTIPAKGSADFGNQYTRDTAECVSDSINAGTTTGFVGGAAVTGNSASQPLVAIVNQVDIPLMGQIGMVFPELSASNGANASAYSAFSPDKGASTLAFPIMLNNFFSINTGFNVMNVGSADIVVICNYKGKADGVDVDVNVSTESIAPGATSNQGQNAIDEIPAEFIGSATCTANGGRIVAVSNQVGGTGDTLFTYEAFTQ